MVGMFPPPDKRRTSQAAAAEVEGLLRIGEPLLAYDAIQQAMEKWPDDIRLRQLRGLALARSGALYRANEELQTLREEGCTDGETLGLLARTHKDLALAEAQGPSRDRHLAAAFEIYSDGYRESLERGVVADGYYTGINAATMALLRGDTRRARNIATQVEKLCKQAIGAGDSGDSYWPQATLAEVALILGEQDKARQRYATAASIAGHRYGDLSSTRHQARLLLAYLGESPEWLDEAMRLPPVLLYTGHMIDSPQRSEPRFPPHMADAVRADIHARLERLGPLAAYGSAACGADILCLECMRELGGELHIILPFPAEDFRATSVELRPDGQWGERFSKLLDDAKEVLVISQRPPPSGESIYEYSNLIMTGLAKLKAQMLDTRLHGIAVWDGKPAEGEGGTGSIADLWQRSGIPLEHVKVGADRSPPAPAQTTAAGPSTNRAAAAKEVWAFEYKIETMLFADAVGYSRLTEDQIPLFFDFYAGAVASYNQVSPHKAVHVETAGDGMYMVFDDPETAGRYALGLSDRIRQEDWTARGLPADLNMRIGLHCGPVFVGRDPITGLPLYTGNHTSRTARIEPITPPGQVYASSAFAAVSTARGIGSLHFSYIGRTQLAKGYGVLPLYHVKSLDRGNPQA
jgi:class 3 adenylate cyclase